MRYIFFPSFTPNSLYAFVGLSSSELSASPAALLFPAYMSYPPLLSFVLAMNVFRVSWRSIFLSVRSAFSLLPRIWIIASKYPPLSLLQSKHIVFSNSMGMFRVVSSSESFFLTMNVTSAFSLVIFACAFACSPLHFEIMYSSSAFVVFCVHSRSHILPHILHSLNSIFAGV